MDLLGFRLNCSKTDPQYEDSAFYENTLSSESNHSSPQITPCCTPLPEIISHSKIKISLSQRKKEMGADSSLSRCEEDQLEKLLKHKIKEITAELDLETDDDIKIARWHEEINPRLVEAEKKPPFRIHEYESKIKSKLTTSGRRLSFDDIVKEEPSNEIARYFSAALQLVSSKIFCSKF